MFPSEVKKITLEMEKLIARLEKLDDTSYDRKEAYMTYYKKLIDAWNEKNTNRLVEKWSDVDTAWMSIDTPFQPGHIMEAYEDKYRKAVSIETDFRI